MALGRLRRMDVWTRMCERACLHIVMAHKIMVYIAMARIVMARIVMAYIFYGPYNCGHGEGNVEWSISSLPIWLHNYIGHNDIVHSAPPSP